jgi:hypothetical protein
MTDAFGWLFLYTPVPYLAAMYFVAYRHDLKRLAKSFRDRSSNAEWYSVCKELGLIGSEAKPPSARLLEGTHLLLIAASLALYAAASLLVSLVLPWYYLLALQAAVAVPLFLLLVTNWTGPFPFKPYRDFLPYPRLGTRVRSLAGKKPDARERAPISTTGGTP